MFSLVRVLHHIAHFLGALALVVLSTVITKIPPGASHRQRNHRAATNLPPNFSSVCRLSAGRVDSGSKTMLKFLAQILRSLALILS